MFLLRLLCLTSHLSILAAIFVKFAFEELIELFQYLLLRVGYLVFFLIYPYGVRLAASLEEVPLVVVLAASSPASVHQLLVVAHCHLWGRDAPGLVAFRLFVLARAISARVRAALIGCVATTDIEICLALLLRLLLI